MESINLAFDEQYSIISLLPYTGDVQLINKRQKIGDLYFIKSLVAFSVTALEHFLRGNLYLFDGHVGENLCQIRAYAMLHLSKKWLESSVRRNQFSQELSLFKNYINKLELVIFEWEEAIKNSTSYNKNLDGKESINDFFKRHELLFDLNDDVIFIIICCFLTQFNIRDIKNIPIAINLEYISKEFQISKYRAKRLSHKYQQMVCSFGCNFVKNVAEADCLRFLPLLYKISDEERAVFPCFIASEIIFHNGIKEKIPVFLVVHRINDFTNKEHDVIYFLLSADQDNSELSLIPCLPHQSKHCLVVCGEAHYPDAGSINLLADYVTHFLRLGPLKLISANTASHPQYSGKKLAAFRANPFHAMPMTEETLKHQNNLLHMQNFALTAGCSRDNPSLFLLKHIYANTVTNEISRLEKNSLGFTYEAYQVQNTFKKVS